MPEYATGGIVEPDPGFTSGEPPEWLTGRGCPGFLMNAEQAQRIGVGVLEKLNEEH